MITEYTSTPTTEDFEDLAASFAGGTDDLASGLTKQIDLGHQININDSCGKYWTGYYNSHGVWKSQPIRCGQCDECLQRKADQDRKRIIRRIKKRFEDNNALVVSLRKNVPEAQKVAFQKRLQRDSTAQNYHATNEAGSDDFIIQSEKVYGEVIENLDELNYDFLMATKVAKATGKRQTGLLYSRKSKKVEAEKPETYPLNLTRVTAVKPDDSKRITTIAKSIKPTEYAHNPEDHQKRIFELTARLTGALGEAGIPFRTEGIVRRAKDLDRLKYNANVEICPIKSPIETDISIGALSGQISIDDALSDKEYWDKPLPYVPIQTTVEQDARREFQFCWFN